MRSNEAIKGWQWRRRRRRQRNVGRPRDIDGPMSASLSAWMSMLAVIGVDTPILSDRVDPDTGSRAEPSRRELRIPGSY